MMFDMLTEHATSLGVPEFRDLTAPSLVRRLQVRLGEQPCCGTDQRYTCRQYDCPWRNTCVRLLAAWQR